MAPDCSGEIGVCLNATTHGEMKKEERQTGECSASENSSEEMVFA